MKTALVYTLEKVRVLSMGFALSLVLVVFASSSSHALNAYGEDCDRLLEHIDPTVVATELLRDPEIQELLDKSSGTTTPTQVASDLQSRHPDVSKLRTTRTDYAQIAAGARRLERRLGGMHYRMSYFVGLSRLDLDETELPLWRRVAAAVSMAPLVAYTVPLIFLNARAEELGVRPEAGADEAPKGGGKLRYTLETLRRQVEIYGEMAAAAERVVARIQAKLDAIDAEVRRELSGR